MWNHGMKDETMFAETLFGTAALAAMFYIWWSNSRELKARLSEDRQVEMLEDWLALECPEGIEDL